MARVRRAAGCQAPAPPCRRISRWMAASEIGQLSGTSVAVAEQAGSLIERLVPRIRETAKLVQDIAAASAEQNTGSGQLKTAVQSLDKVIQQNAAAAEQMAAAAAELSTQAAQLQSAIAFFRTAGDTAATASTPEPAPRPSA